MDQDEKYYLQPPAMDSPLIFASPAFKEISGIKYWSLADRCDWTLTARSRRVTGPSAQREVRLADTLGLSPLGWMA